MDVATLTELLREAEERHGNYEPTAPKHHWSGWYGAYIVARREGEDSPRTPSRTPRSTSKVRADEGRHRSRCGLSGLRAFGSPCSAPQTLGVEEESPDRHTVPMREAMNTSHSQGPFLLPLLFLGATAPSPSPSRRDAARRRAG